MRRLGAATLASSLAFFLVAGLAAGRAAADAGAALVTGRASAHHRDVVRLAIEDELRKAGWALPQLGGAERRAMSTCLATEQPWPCLTRVTAARSLRRVLAIEVEREPGPRRQLRLTGQLSATDGPRRFIDSRYCGPCGDPQLDAAARQLAQRLLTVGAVRGEATRIEVRTTPPGATIRLDGRMVEAPDQSIATSPGWHTIHLQLSGYRAELRQVLAPEGQRTVVEVELRPAEPAAPTAAPRAHLEVIGAPAAGAPPASWIAPPPSAGPPSAGPPSAAPRLEAPPSHPPPPPPPRSHLTGARALRAAAARAAQLGAEPGQPLARGPAQQPARRPDPARRRRLGWALSVAGGALLIAGGALLALDEDAERDPTRRHEPLYFDSAPAGVSLLAIGGAVATTGLVLVLISPPPPAPAPPGGLVGYAGSF